MIDRSQLVMLIPPEAVPPGSELADSLARWGNAAPLLIHGRQIVDGIKRWSVFSPEQRATVPLIETSLASPFLARFLANASREWNIIETALLLQHLSESERQALAVSRRIALAPNLLNVFAYLSSLPSCWARVIDSALPVSVWRDLGALGNRLGEAVELMLTLSGTVAEKRMLAGLLRQAHLRHLLPSALASRDLSVLLTELQQLVSPRRDDVKKRYDEAIADTDLPPNTELTVDPVFEKPGVTVKLHLRRQELARLERLRQSLDHLFARIPEL
ncbi:MAG TPA: hypothetical protein PKO06_01465 [Candidatus Ozemobacteraceae bacterium]|nr:hypothetical protein [Candidatus Ozemobacteraceae bacterium]